MRITYNIARADFEKLEELLELNDQVDIDSDREYLMQNPTKTTAMRMYISCIKLWFSEHGVINGTEDIAKRYGCL
jgi:hypothetical protein